MRRKLVAGNWKMHGSRAENAPLVEAILSSPQLERADCVICPPFVYLAEIARLLRGAAAKLGAQDVCAETHGAYTGEVSAAMLRDVGCSYVIVGHSERRGLYGEDDVLVARKFAAALSQGLTPILCLGELLGEREAGRTQDVVGRQLEAVVALTGIAGFAQAVIAYEPVWAIGTGRTASPEQAQEVHAFIRARLAAQDAKIAAALSQGLTPILCLGESLAEREAAHTQDVVGRQLEAVVALTGIAGFAQAVIAYEPVWAIGTGRTASPEQAQEVHGFIRQRLAQRDGKIAGALPILYGGSVKTGNARELFAQRDVDGGLIGGASLKAEEFLSIVAAARG